MVRKVMTEFVRGQIVMGYFELKCPLTNQRACLITHDVYVRAIR